MAKYRFKLMFNTYTDFNTGKVYDAKDNKRNIIETDIPLDELFENKFQRLHGKATTAEKTVLGKEEFLKQQQQSNNQVGVQSEEVEEEDKTTEEDAELLKSPLNEESENTPKDKEEVAGPHDVTDKFKKAKSADLKVWFDGEKYSVTDADDKKNTPLNKKKKLVTEKDVDHFIKDHK